MGDQSSNVALLGAALDKILQIQVGSTAQLHLLGRVHIWKAIEGAFDVVTHHPDAVPSVSWAGASPELHLTDEPSQASSHNNRIYAR